MGFTFKGKKYYWDYRVLLKNMGIMLLIAFFIIGYLVVSHMDVQTMLGK